MTRYPRRTDRICELAAEIATHPNGFRIDTDLSGEKRLQPLLDHLMNYVAALAMDAPSLKETDDAVPAGDPAVAAGVPAGGDPAVPSDPAAAPAGGGSDVPAVRGGG